MAAPSPVLALADAALENRPASANVAGALRRAIIDGTLPGGERLRQDAVAVRFGVSQTIVREAFQLLVAEGLLHAEPRRGVSVASLSMADAEEMTQLRALLEPQALAWAIPNMTSAELDAAARVAADLDHTESPDRRIVLNALFHEGLYAPARRERTLAIIATLRTNFERYLRLSLEATWDQAQSQREHWELLDLCRAGDAAAAAALLKRHVMSTGERVITRLRARSSL